ATPPVATSSVRRKLGDRAVELARGSKRRKRRSKGETGGWRRGEGERGRRSGTPSSCTQPRRGCDSGEWVTELAAPPPPRAPAPGRRAPPAARFQSRVPPGDTNGRTFPPTRPTASCAGSGVPRGERKPS